MITCDKTLRDRVSSAVGYSSLVGNRRIQVESDSGRVILRGVVSSYYQKQMAQETLLRVDGVETVENHLLVQRDSGLIC